MDEMKNHPADDVKGPAAEQAAAAPLDAPKAPDLTGETLILSKERCAALDYLAPKSAPHRTDEKAGVIRDANGRASEVLNHDDVLDEVVLLLRAIVALKAKVEGRNAFMNRLALHHSLASGPNTFDAFCTRELEAEFRRDPWPIYATPAAPSPDDAPDDATDEIPFAPAPDHIADTSNMVAPAQPARDGEGNVIIRQQSTTSWRPTAGESDTDPDGGVC